jgi:hypothetical protein
MRLPLQPTLPVLALLCLPACGTTTYSLPMQVDPPTASVYINGKRVGQGDRFVYEVDFSGGERICVQAAAKGYEPRMLLLTQKELKAQINTYSDLRWTLTQERL